MPAPENIFPSVPSWAVKEIYDRARTDVENELLVRAAAESRALAPMRTTAVSDWVERTARARGEWVERCRALRTYMEGLADLLERYREARGGITPEAVEFDVRVKHEAGRCYVIAEVTCDGRPVRLDEPLLGDNAVRARGAV